MNDSYLLTSIKKFISHLNQVICRCESKSQGTIENQNTHACLIGICRILQTFLSCFHSIGVYIGLMNAARQEIYFPFKNSITVNNECLHMTKNSVVFGNPSAFGLGRG